ncbi:hypothetical protein [Nostoc sp.]|uniref:hypothetical protein n=1 Tax=Nostoc sp. TaxID=1180 RepID=UPI002FFD1B7E
MKAYSLDLRQKIVDAYACGDISQRKLAKNVGLRLRTFSVASVQEPILIYSRH